MIDTVTTGGEFFYTDYEIPEDDSIIWRFLDLAKFMTFRRGCSRSVCVCQTDLV